MPDIYYILTMRYARKLQKKEGEVFSESIRKTESHKKEESLAAAMRDNWQLYILVLPANHLFCGFQLPASVWDSDCL